MPTHTEIEQLRTSGTTPPDWRSLAVRLVNNTVGPSLGAGVGVATEAIARYLPDLLDGWRTPEAHAWEVHRAAAYISPTVVIEAEQVRRDNGRLRLENQMLREALAVGSAAKRDELITVLQQASGRCPKPADDCWRRHVGCLARRLHTVVTGSV